MSNVLHSTAIYRKYYKSFLDFYIQKYCEAQKNGFNKKSSFNFASIRLQDYIVSLLNQDRENNPMIIRAYSSIKNDVYLHDKAIAHYKKYN